MSKIRLASILSAVLALLAAAARADDPPQTPPPAAPEPPRTTSTAGTSLTAAEGAGLRVVMFSMGQADCMLIVGPGGPDQRSVLVDCGAATGEAKKDHGTAERLARRYEPVKDRIVALTGQPHVDDVIVTHFHSDHVGDAPDSEHEASGFWWLFAHGVSTTAILDHGDAYPSFGEESHPHKEWAAVLPQWKEHGVYSERHTPRVGEELALGGGAKIRFVAVNGNGVLEKAKEKGSFKGETTPNENDYSIAFVLTLGNFSMYSGGDLSGENVVNHSGGGRTKRHDAYTDIETKIRDAVGNVEVLRVDHHGSKHSTNEAFVQTLRPEVSLVSCGEGNSYHHPEKEVVARLQAFGPVFVTSGLANDWSGAENAPKVEGAMTLTVAGDGGSYAIVGKDGEVFHGKSFSAEDKKKGLDHPDVKTKS